MNRVAAVLLLPALFAACGPSTPPQPGKPALAAAATPRERLEHLVASNATIAGYLYTADKPYVIVTFRNGLLQWRTDPQSQSIIQGPAQLYSDADRMCIGFSAKNPSLPAQGPERYMVCEALQAIEHSNSLPRSQDFRLSSGSTFLEYQPPAGTGYAQLFYATRTD
jgi:hypothetical protein